LWFWSYEADRLNAERFGERVGIECEIGRVSEVENVFGQGECVIVELTGIEPVSVDGSRCEDESNFTLSSHFGWKLFAIDLSSGEQVQAGGGEARTVAVSNESDRLFSGKLCDEMGEVEPIVAAALSEDVHVEGEQIGDVDIAGPSEVDDTEGLIWS